MRALRMRHAAAWPLLLLLAVSTEAGAAAPDDLIFADGYEAGPCSSEICDSLDTDCDGVIDNDCVYCNPLDPTALCGPSAHCSPQPNGDSVCSHPAGALVQGNACNSLADCAGAFTCVDTGTGGECLLWCQSSGACPGFATCVFFDPPLRIGLIEWGVCL